MDRNRRIALGAAAAIVVIGIGLVPQLLDDDNDSGGDDGPTVNGPPAATVIANDRRFTPRTLTVEEAKDVRFVNNADEAHTFTADDGLFDSHTVEPGDDYRFAFDGPRTVSFHCEIHPSMKGTIEITAG